MTVLAFARKPKYRNQRVTVDGINFASKREAARYRELLLMERVNQIRNIKLQPRFPMSVNGKHVCTYVGDFSYCTNPKPGDQHVGRFVVEDAKGFKTPEYKLKAKLFEAVMGFPITEV